MNIAKPKFDAVFLRILCLSLVIGFGAILRVKGISFGLPALNDADELMFELGATRILVEQTLNPGWFGHPATTTMYALAFINYITFIFGSFAGPPEFLDAIYRDPSIVILPGRMLIATFGVLSIWQTWRLGQLLSGESVNYSIAGFSALLLACSPINVQYSQIIRSDIMGCFFMLMCIGSAFHIAENGRKSDYRWAAFWLALGIATKWPFILTSLSIAGAALAHAKENSGSGRIQIKNLIEAAVLTVIGVIVISPYLLLDYQTVLNNLGGEARNQHLGSTGGTLIENAWWYLSGPLTSGLGWFGILLAIWGLWALLQKPKQALVLFPLLLAYCLVLSISSLRWERWVLPLLPLLALAAGLGANIIIGNLRENRQLAWLLICVTPLSLASQSWSASSIRMNDTRQQATQWGQNNIPAGSRVMIEHFAFDMIDEPWVVLFPLGDAGCVDARSMLENKIDYKVIQKARSGRSNLDYGTLNEEEQKSCEVDFGILTQMDRYKAEKERFPREYSAYRGLMEEMEEVKILRPEPGLSSGPIIRILRRRP